MKIQAHRVTVSIRKRSVRAHRLPGSVAAQEGFVSLCATRPNPASGRPIKSYRRVVDSALVRSGTEHDAASCDRIGAEVNPLDREQAPGETAKRLIGSSRL